MRKETAARCPPTSMVMRIDVAPPLALDVRGSVHRRPRAT
jgi:hypothetical protein